MLQLQQSRPCKASEAQHSKGANEPCMHVYVDDIGGSRENEARCKKVTRKLQSTPYKVTIDTILSTGQFQVKAWHSNNENINQSDEECPDFLGHKCIKFLTRFPLKRAKSQQTFKKGMSGQRRTNVGSHGARSTVHH